MCKIKIIYNTKTLSKSTKEVKYNMECKTFVPGGEKITI